MKYGQHTDLGEKVIETFLSDSFLDTTQNDNSFVVISDIERADNLAFEEQDGEYETWHDLHEMESSKIHGLKYSYSGSPEVLLEIKNVYGILEEHAGLLYQKYSESNANFINLVDNILSDFDTCFLQAALSGKQDGFFGLVFEAYENSLIPCGWKGNYPEGSLVCLKPNKKGP